MKVRPSNMGKTINNWAARNKGKLAVAASLGFHAAAAGLLRSLNESAVNLIANFGVVALVPATIIISIAYIIHDNLKGKRTFLPQIEEHLKTALKNQREETVSQARNAIDRFTESGTSSINWGEFIPRAEALEDIHESDRLGRLPLPEEKWDRSLAKHAEALKSILRNAPDDPLKRFQAAYGYLSIKWIPRYRSGQATLYRRLEGSRGNCESQAKFVLSLVSTIYDWEHSTWKPAVANYSDHLEIVLYNATTKQVYDPSIGRIVDHDKVPTSIFDVHLFAHAYLKGKRIDHKTPGDFLLLKHDPSLNDDYNAKIKTNSKFKFDAGMDLPCFEMWFTFPWINNILSSVAIVGLRRILFNISRTFLRYLRGASTRLTKGSRKFISAAILLLASLGLYHKCTAETNIEQKEIPTAYPDVEQKQEPEAQHPYLTLEEARERLAELKDIARRSDPLSREEDAIICIDHLRNLSKRRSGFSKFPAGWKGFTAQEKLFLHEYEKIIDIFFSPEGAGVFSKTKPKQKPGRRYIYEEAFYASWPRDFMEFERLYVNGLDFNNNTIYAKFPSHLRQMHQIEWQQYRKNSYFIIMTPSGNTCPYKDELVKAGYLKENALLIHELIDRLKRPEDLDLPIDRDKKGYCFSDLKFAGSPTPTHNYGVVTLVGLKLHYADRIYLIEPNRKETGSEYYPPLIIPRPPIEVELEYDEDHQTQKALILNETKLVEQKEQTSIYISTDDFVIRFFDYAFDPRPLDLLNKISDEDINKIKPDLIEFLKRERSLWIFLNHQKTFFDYKSRTRILLEQDISETKKKFLLAIMYKYFMSFTGLEYKNGSIVSDTDLEQQSKDYAQAIRSHRTFAENDPLLRKAKEAYLELVRETD